MRMDATRFTVQERPGVYRGRPTAIIVADYGNGRLGTEPEVIIIGRPGERRADLIERARAYAKGMGTA